MNINEPDGKGDTLLYKSCSCSAYEYRITEYLLRRGADVTTPDIDGNTILHKLCKNTGEKYI